MSKEIVLKILDDKLREVVSEIVESKGLEGLLSLSRQNRLSPNETILNFNDRLLLLKDEEDRIEITDSFDKIVRVMFRTAGKLYMEFHKKVREKLLKEANKDQH